MDEQTPNNGITWDTGPSGASQANPSTQAQPSGGITWDGADQQAAPPPSDEIQTNPSDDLVTKATKAAGGVLEGVGEGVFGTAAGATDALGGKGTGFSDALHTLAGDKDQQHGTAQQIGHGLETIGEFIMGDEALKGLSLAQKLQQSSKVMAIIEKSPKLAQALNLGINVGKVGGELTPEERAMLKASPRLARYAALGMESVRAGAVQAGQTAVRSGNINPLTDEGRGNLEHAASEGGKMALGNAVIGGTLGEVGNVLGKGAKAADKAGALSEAAKNGPTSVEAGQAVSDAANQANNRTLAEINAGVKGAKDTLQNASDTAEQLGLNAPTNEEITAKAQEHAQNGLDKLGADYEQNASKVSNDLEGHTIDYHESPMQLAAQDIVTGPGKSTEGIAKDVGMVNPASPDLVSRITRLADEAAGTDPKTGEKIKVTADDLLEFAKKYKQDIRNTDSSTQEGRANRDVLFKMLDGVHQSLEQLAKNAGKPESYQLVKDMNSQYKNGLQVFRNPDVQALLKGGKESNILTYLSGGKSVGDIKAIKSAMGPDAFGSLADNAVQRMAANATDANGEFSFNKFLQGWNKIPPDVRDEMFKGSPYGKTIDGLVEKVQGVNASGAIPQAEEATKAANDSLQKILGNGDVSSLIKDPTRVQALSQLVGPDGMAELGKTVLQNQLREAATKGAGEVGQVNTGKFLKFVESLKDSPEVVNSLFKPTEESAQAYAKLLNDVKDVHGVKNLIKAGVIATPIASATGLVGALSHSAISALLGGSVAALGEGKISGLIEDIANHPKMWAALRALGKPRPVLAPEGSRVIRAAIGKPVGSGLTSLASALSGTQSQLSQ
jgi:hypothetical protein